MSVHGKNKQLKSVAFSGANTLSMIPVADTIACRLRNDLATLSGGEQTGDDGFGVGISSGFG
jgi:hypothetical protein